MANSPSETNPPELGESRRTVALLIAALFFLIVSATIGGMLFVSAAGFTPSKVFAKIRSLTLAREKALQGEDADRVNILLLGMGGVGHEGATLTDTIVVASIRPSDTQVGLLSIPRDLQIKIPGYGYGRINTVNAYTERDSPGTGAAQTARIISEILDQPIHYYIRVDFAAFKKIIDTGGGIEVNVEQSFYDPFYPDDNFGYAPVSFEKGVQTMNGERALQFVRSRHGTGGEGNDFARARRQQKILLALKDRLLSFDVLLRPKRIKAIIESLKDHIQTNIALWEGLRFANLLKNIDPAKIKSQVLDSSPEGLLRERNYNGAFVLEPKDQTWGEVRSLAAQIFEENPPAKSSIYSPPTPPLPPLPPTPSLSPPRAGGEHETISPPLGGGARGGLVITDTPTVEIQNGTYITGLAARTAEKLEGLGFNPVGLGNSATRDVATTVIYDLAAGKKPADFEKLKTLLKAVAGEGEPLHIISKERLDFLIILGANAAQ
ncbi:LCP family protein [Candidatus Uhrbacteria bacterium]|nr:LCP family protein [Candidatus Uhrbacteria bacterium]